MNVDFTDVRRMYTQAWEIRTLHYGTRWHYAAWHAHVLVNDKFGRPMGINRKLFNSACENGIVFG